MGAPRCSLPARDCNEASTKSTLPTDPAQLPGAEALTADLPEHVHFERRDDGDESVAETQRPGRDPDARGEPAYAGIAAGKAHQSPRAHELRGRDRRVGHSSSVAMRPASYRSARPSTAMPTNRKSPIPCA